ncbi:hypothetical protein MASR2M18_19690 [Ignavibacteria bacterium]|nr:response regulator [Bacteroidota bacterium]MCZ2131622.1 response regulator [Bacteroidota bacterium]
MPITADFDILIADDEPAILVTLKKIVSGVAPNARIATARDGSEARKFLENQTVDILLTDIDMPNMSGLELCRAVKSNKRTAETYCIVLTGLTAGDQQTKALQYGADDFIAKPFSVAELGARLRIAFRIASLKRQIDDDKNRRTGNAAIDDGDLREVIDFAAGLLQSRFPQAISMFSRIEHTALWISEHFTDISYEDRRNIALAARFCYAGRLLIPAELQLRPMMREGRVSEPSLKQIPAESALILGSVKKLVAAAGILASVYENFDGSGFPAGKSSWQIPLGSRILRVVLDFEEISEFSHGGFAEADSALQMGINHLYDRRVVLLHQEYRANSDGTLRNPEIRSVQLKEALPGMILVRDLYANSGLKLLPAGAVFSHEILERIAKHIVQDPILGNIYVKNDVK